MLSVLGRDTQKKYKKRSLTYWMNSLLFEVSLNYKLYYIFILWLFVLKNKVKWQVTSFSRDVFVELAELTAM